MVDAVTTTTVAEGDPPPSGDGAVGVVAGAAAVEAGRAQEDAAAAQAAADAAAAEAIAAEDTAGAAYQAALAADVRSLDTAGKLDALATIQLHQAQQAAQAASAPATPAGEGKVKDDPPKNLEKKAKRKTWRERWEVG
jgi:hypothetical protein